MSDEQINEAIAEECGLLGPWTEQITPCGCDGQWALFNSDGVRLHDYCNDLNAIQDAVMTLPENKRVLYGAHLAFACGHTVKGSVGLWKISTATARQRAEAFLRTLGKWEEAK